MRTPGQRGAIRPKGRSTAAVLVTVLLALGGILVDPNRAAAHGAPIIDGLYTGDWCAPGFVGAVGSDTWVPLPPPLCPLGFEIFWDDWDSVTYGGGIGDTMGWLVGGVIGAPLSDPEVDIDFFATTADAAMVFFTVQLGPYPSTGGPPPHVQIAIDIDGALSGNPFWYDPLAAGTLPTGLASVPAPVFADYLITTDGPGGLAQVWEATSVPGAWTPTGPPVPLGWSGPVPPGPGVFELAVPWPIFVPGPVFALGVPASLAIMAAHGGPAPGSPPTAADAPLTPSEDVFSEAGFGYTASPDLCPSGPPNTDCEIYLGPGGGAGSSDAYVPVLYPVADLAITNSNGISTVIPGTLVTYTTTASNPTGPSAAAGATVVNLFPQSLSGCTWSCTGTGSASCTPTGVGDINDSVTLPVGGVVTYTTSCSLASTATGNLVNTALILAPLGVIDPFAGNDSATDTDTILALDFGDAPDPTYSTLFASNGARHAITGAFLGAGVDSETDGQPTASADGDDLDGNDDEDGVAFTSAIVAGQLSTVTVTASGTGALDAWIDLNADGDWNDLGEQIFTSTTLAAGANALSFTPASAALAGSSFARFRLSQTGGLASAGLATDGEVEDYSVSITRSSDLAITNTDGRDPATAGLSLRYTLTTTNGGPSDAGTVIVTDTLPTATSFLGVVPGAPTCTHSSGIVTCDLAELAAIGTADVIVTVLVDANATGTLSNSASVSAAEPDPIPGNNTDGEDTTVVTPLFADAFETGDLTAWDNSSPLYQLKTVDLSETRDQLWVSFRLDNAVLHRLQPSPVTLLAGVGIDGTQCFSLELRGNRRNRAIRAQVRLDDGRWADTGWQDIEPMSGWINLSWRRAIEEIHDGSLEVRIDGSLVLELTTLDNSRSAVGALEWAEVEGRPAAQGRNPHRPLRPAR